MKNDVNFRNKLIVEYLLALVQSNNREVFNQYFAEAEPYLESRIHSSTSKDEIVKIQGILEFKKKENVIEMQV